MNVISKKNPMWEINGRPQVQKAEYLSKDFAELEDTQLWPKVWQVACHETEVARVGDYVTYDVGNESVIIVRTEDDGLKAYHNVCPHRGRALTDGNGSTKEFRCGYHGWRFDLEGNNVYVQDEEDWEGSLCRKDLKLHEIQVDHWGGWVWINMDPGAEPLLKFLGAVAERMECYDLHEYKIRWYKTFKLACNWKLVVEAFNEGYHVAATHPELLSYNEDYTQCQPFGIHTCYWQSPKHAPNNPALIGRSRRKGGVDDSSDFRQFLVTYTEDFDKALGAMVTEEQIRAAHEVLAELPKSASQADVMGLWVEKRQKIAEQKGINWPEISPEYIEQCWHVFPNTVFLPTVDGLLWYRARPIKGDPDHCYYDVLSLERCPPDETPEFTHEVYPDWRTASPGRILSQDYENLERVQQGMKSSAFRQSRLNPVQEVCISNFHRALQAQLNIEEGRSTVD